LSPIRRGAYELRCLFQQKDRIVERLVTDVPETDPALRVDKKCAVHRQVVEVEKAISLENIELQ
jgi:hypothetical protein